MKERRITNVAERPAKSGQLLTTNPRVKILDRVICLVDSVSRNTKDDEEQREAVALKEILNQRKAQLEAA